MLHAQKPLPQGYPREVKTIGDHIKKVRLDRRLTKSQVAEFFGVSYHAVSDWETNTVSPTTRLMPKVIEFLGYAPYNNLESLGDGEKIRTCRKLLGLTLQEASVRLGVCPTTLSAWENGRGIRKKAYWKTIVPFINSACRA